LREWIAALILVVLLLVDELVLHSGNWSFIWQDVLYFLALSASIVFSANTSSTDLRERCSAGR